MAQKQEPANTAEESLEPIFVARQPLFDGKMDIWGYELLFRHSGEAKGAVVDDGNVATAKVISDGFSLAKEGLTDDRKVLINFPEQLLVAKTPLALPPNHCVVEILETVKPKPDVIASLKHLKAKDYKLALDDFTGSPGFEPFLKLVDYVKIDILGMEVPEIIALTQMVKQYNVKLIAEKVEDKRVYDVTKALGFHYFQGYFFSKPEIMEGKKMSMTAMAKFDLLRRLSSEDYEVSDVAKVISQDTSLTFRLMNYLNSASISLPYKIKSIPQAITMMGQDSLKQWLMATVISDSGTSPRAEELSFRSAQRGKFLFLMTPLLLKPLFDKDTMFLLGMFSKLDALFDQPMSEIVDTLPLDDEIKAALLGERNKARQWIVFVNAIESARWDVVRKVLSYYRIDPQKTALMHNQAARWANDLIRVSLAQRERSSSS